mmetsp:Transcript_13498/g.24853  ORF Transcript_13498/g.24853 Transcript_13498/m.24853 type:complete len:220 (+) Transcript_13498:766-1425(+)
MDTSFCPTLGETAQSGMPASSLPPVFFFFFFFFFVDVDASASFSSFSCSLFSSSSSTCNLLASFRSSSSSYPSSKSLSFGWTKPPIPIPSGVSSSQSSMTSLKSPVCLALGVLRVSLTTCLLTPPAVWSGKLPIKGASGLLLLEAADLKLVMETGEDRLSPSSPSLSAKESLVKESLSLSPPSMTFTIPLSMKLYTGSTTVKFPTAVKTTLHTSLVLRG